tara:strand:+ start:689 stop:889 length:201 start_codon:yes stop_codon:yes gene_type:complete
MKNDMTEEEYDTWIAQVARIMTPEQMEELQESLPVAQFEVAEIFRVGLPVNEREARKRAKLKLLLN